MNLGTYGILIAFAAFIVLMILNPKLSCFGRRIRSPFYPVLRRRQKKTRPPVKTDDYGFRMGEGRPRGDGSGPPEGKKEQPVKKTDDYGFRLD
jgi:hypothetical protein